MDGFVKMEPLEEFKNLSEIKVEPLDYDIEQFGKLKSYSCFDEIEFGA